MRIDTLFLDAGGVLVHPNWEKVSGAFARAGVRVPAAALAAVEARAKREIDLPRGAGPRDDAARNRAYFEAVLRHAGVDAPAPRFEEAFALLRGHQSRGDLWETVLPGTEEALRRLRAAGLRMAVVSNSNGTVRPKLERVGLAAHFDHVIDSHEVGSEKPDPGIFRMALERCGSAAGRAAHCGDLYEVDVVGARAAGLEAVLLDPLGLYADRDCRRVRSLGDLATMLGA